MGNLVGHKDNSFVGNRNNTAHIEVEGSDGIAINDETLDSVTIVNDHQVAVMRECGCAWNEVDPRGAGLATDLGCCSISC